MVLIGVAIAVPDPVGSMLQDYRVQHGDTSAEQIPTHVTLLPPTAVADELVPAIVTHLAQAAGEHQPFGVHLRGTGTFRPVSPVVFVNLVEGISACELLAKSVVSGPLEVDLDFPYHPHVTIAHDVDEECLDEAFDDLAGFDAEFTCTRFWLYTFDEGIGWSPGQAFDLAP